MNVTMIAALALLAGWAALLVTRQPTTGWIHALLAVGVVLAARRIIVGAPKFLS